MFEVTPQEIEQMQFVLEHYKTRGRFLPEDYLIKDIGIDNKRRNYLLSLICEHSDAGLNLVKYEKSTGGTYAILSLDEFRYDKFIKNGGFKAYFAALNPVEKKKSYLTKQWEKVKDNPGSTIRTTALFVIAILAFFDVTSYKDFFPSKKKAEQKHIEHKKSHPKDTLVLNKK